MVQAIDVEHKYKREINIEKEKKSKNIEKEIFKRNGVKDREIHRLSLRPLYFWPLIFWHK